MTHRILNQHHDHHMKALKKSKFEPSKDRLHSILFIHESQFKGNLYQKYFQNHHLKCTNCYMTLYLCMKQKYGNSTTMNTNRKNIHGDTPLISFFQICFHRKLMYQYLKFMQVSYIKILYFYNITCIKTFSSLNVEIYISG